MIKFFKHLLGIQPKDQYNDHVFSFHEQRAKEEDVEIIEHGIKTIAIENITGSVGKYHDFDSEFRPKSHVSEKRFSDIKRIMRKGGPLPPITLYQIRNDYYVIDGNHRVAAAKELGWSEIRASVVELLSARNTMENLLYIERKLFYKTTGLVGKIDLTEVGKYKLLEKQIKKHQAYLERVSGRKSDLKKAARDWYSTIFIPMTAIIASGGLDKYFPKRTVADLYAYISFNRWERTSNYRYGIGIDKLIPKNMEDFRKKMLEKNTPDYPEMKRSITAFVLINIDTSSQSQVEEKLFAKDGIEEVHSVHGTYDILVKMVLKRDFLASDAEIISEYVDHNIRSIGGINRTQTIIPGMSKVKDIFMP
jgi:hypothetical protein